MIMHSRMRRDQLDVSALSACCQ